MSSADQRRYPTAPTRVGSGAFIFFASIHRFIVAKLIPACWAASEVVNFPLIMSILSHIFKLSMEIFIVSIAGFRLYERAVYKARGLAPSGQLRRARLPGRKNWMKSLRCSTPSGRNQGRTTGLAKGVYRADELLALRIVRNPIIDRFRRKRTAALHGGAILGEERELLTLEELLPQPEAGPEALSQCSRGHRLSPAST